MSKNEELTKQDNGEDLVLFGNDLKNDPHLQRPVVEIVKSSPKAFLEVAKINNDTGNIFKQALLNDKKVFDELIEKIKNMTMEITSKEIKEYVRMLKETQEAQETLIIMVAELAPNLLLQATEAELKAKKALKDENDDEEEDYKPRPLSDIFSTPKVQSPIVDWIGNMGELQQTSEQKQAILQIIEIDPLIFLNYATKNVAFSRAFEDSDILNKICNRIGAEQDASSRKKMLSLLMQSTDKFPEIAKSFESMLLDTTISDALVTKIKNANGEQKLQWMQKFAELSPDTFLKKTTERDFKNALSNQEVLKTLKDGINKINDQNRREALLKQFQVQTSNNQDDKRENNKYFNKIINKKYDFNVEEDFNFALNLLIKMLEQVKEVRFKATSEKYEEMISLFSFSEEDLRLVDSFIDDMLNNTKRASPEKDENFIENLLTLKDRIDDTLKIKQIQKSLQNKEQIQNTLNDLDALKLESID